MTVVIAGVKGSKSFPSQPGNARYAWRQLRVCDRHESHGSHGYRSVTLFSLHPVTVYNAFCSRFSLAFTCKAASKLNFLCTASTDWNGKEANKMKKTKRTNKTRTGIVERRVYRVFTTPSYTHSRTVKFSNFVLSKIVEFSLSSNM